jgi:hypothetical protein
VNELRFRAVKLFHPRHGQLLLASFSVI